MKMHMIDKCSKAAYEPLKVCGINENIWPHRYDIVKNALWYMYDIWNSMQFHLISNELKTNKIKSYCSKVWGQ